MRLFVDQIRDSGMLLEGQEQADELSRHFARITGEELCFVEPLSYSLRALKVDDLIEIEGHLSTNYHLACSRCLTDFEQPLQAEFSVAFVRQDKFMPDTVDEEGLELAAEELGLSIYQGEEIDLQETLYEQVVLALPPQPLCSTDCRGLCPHCGADLNHEACACDPEPFNGKFSALKNFKPS